MKYTRSFLLTNLVLSVVHADLTLTSDGCVDPSGFDSCYSSVTAQAQQCYEKNCSDGTCDGPDDCTSGDANCVMACSAVAYQGWINCAMQSCWNKAPGCEYQNLVLNAYQALDFALAIELPPYSTPASNTPGACSCPIAALFVGVLQSLPLNNHCRAYTAELVNSGGQYTGQGPALGDECSCCAASRGLSLVPNICPNTDISSIPFTQWSSAYAQAVNVLEQNVCVQDFSNNLDCTAEPLNFTMPENGQFFASVPSGGSQAISDTPGTLTAPISATITWALASGLPGTTAVAVTTSGSEGSGSGSSGGSGGSGGSASSSAGAVPTSSGSAAATNAGSTAATSSGSTAATSSGSAAVGNSVDTLIGGTLMLLTGWFLS